MPVTAVALALSLGQAPPLLDPVALLDDEPIHRVELERSFPSVNPSNPWVLRGGPGHPLTAGVSRRLAESVIDDLLLAREARRRGLGSTPEEVEAGVEVVRARSPAPGAFEAMLARNGFTPETHRDAVRRFFDAERMRQALAKEPVVVTDDEVRAEYERRRGTGCRRVFQLVVPVAREATLRDIDHATWLAGQLAALGRAAPDFRAFATLEAARSPGLVRANDLGVMKPGDGVFVPRLERDLAVASVGQVLAPVASPVGWHVVQALEPAPCRLGAWDPERVSLHHLLVKQRAERRVQELLAVLRAKAELRWLDPALAAPALPMH
jgi:hypothetical protein